MRARRDDALGGAVARADHEVAAVEIERSIANGNSGRYRRYCVRAIGMLQKRGMNPVPLDRGDTDPRQWNSVWMSASGYSPQTDLEHLLAAAHAGQPVVNERDLHTAATASGAPMRL